MKYMSAILRKEKWNMNENKEKAMLVSYRLLIKNNSISNIFFILQIGLTYFHFTLPHLPYDVIFPFLHDFLLSFSFSRTFFSFAILFRSFLLSNQARKFRFFTLVWVKVSGVRVWVYEGVWAWPGVCVWQREREREFMDTFCSCFCFFLLIFV